MPSSPAASSVAPGPATHAHPAASKRPCNQTPHVHAARCVGGPAAALWPASHAGRWDTLEGPCCLTCRRRSVKHRLRERKAVPQRQAVPIVAPSTRAPQASATALLLGKLEPLYPPCCPLSRLPTPPPRAPTPASEALLRGRASPPLVDPRDSSQTSPGPSTCRHPTEAVRRVTPARPRATKPSRGIDQLPRSWPLRLRAASSPSRASSQSATEPDAPHTIFTWLVLTPRKAAIVNGPTNFGKNLGCSPRNDRCSDDNNTSSPSQYVCPRLAWVFRSLGQTLVEGQPWVPVGSTVGPRFLAGIRGSPQKIRQRWVPVALW